MKKKDCCASLSSVHRHIGCLREHFLFQRLVVFLFFQPEFLFFAGQHIEFRLERQLVEQFRGRILSFAEGSDEKRQRAEKLYLFYV